MSDLASTITSMDTERKLVTFTFIGYVPKDRNNKILMHEAEHARALIQQGGLLDVIAHQVKEAENTKQMEVLKLSDEVIKLMKAQDWYADYSDDYRVARAGEASYKKLVEKAEQLTQENINVLWEKFAPKGFIPPTSKVK